VRVTVAMDDAGERLDLKKQRACCQFKKKKYFT